MLMQPPVVGDEILTKNQLMYRSLCIVTCYLCPLLRRIPDYVYLAGGTEMAVPHSA